MRIGEDNPIPNHIDFIVEDRWMAMISCGGKNWNSNRDVIYFDNIEELNKTIYVLEKLKMKYYDEIFGEDKDEI